MMARVGVVIVTWGSAEDIGPCLDSLADQEVDAALDVVVVDNGSTDGTRDAVDGSRASASFVALEGNTGYAHATNVGAAAVEGDHVLLLNPDVVLDPGCLSRLVATLEERPAAAGVGARLRNADGSLQLAALRDPTWAQVAFTLTSTGRRLDRLRGSPHERHRTYLDEWARADDEPFPVDVQIGACLLLRRAHLPPRLFDERFPLYFNDGDLCRRVRTHGPLLVDPRAGAMHRRGTSTHKVPHPRLRAEFFTSLFRYADRWWPWWSAWSMRLLLLVESVIYTAMVRLRGRTPTSARAAVFGSLGLVGGAPPWFGPPAGWLPDRTMRRGAA